jgi:hypothetical protein
MSTGGRDLAGLLARLPHVVGAELAEVVGRLSVEVGALSDAQRLELVAATARVEAWTASVRARAVHAVYRSVERELAADAAELGSGPVSITESFEEERFLRRRVAVEVSLVLGVSSWVADREVDLALDLAAHPALGRALAAGRLDRTQAVLICRGLRERTNSDPARERVLRGRLVARLLGPDDGPDDCPDGDEFDPEEPAYDVDDRGEPVGVVRELAHPGGSLWMLVPGRLKAILAREVVRLDPAAAARAAEAAREDRRVSFDPQPSFMADLVLHAGADAAGAAWANLDATARAAKTALSSAGDHRTLDQLRADIAVGWLTEGAHGLQITRPAATGAEAEPGARSTVCVPRPRGPLVHLTVAATTMLGLDREPAVLHGPAGPLPVPDTIARELAHTSGARWRRLLYDPATGIATELSRAYQPPERMAEFVRARDGQITRHPTSCATHLELDHVREYDRARPERGGLTTAPNLATRGHRVHQLKTDRILTVTGTANQTLTITTPAGRTYRSHPHLYADPDPPPF